VRGFDANSPQAILERMDARRWREVEAVFLAARDRDPHSRRTFLDEACKSDPALRDEIDALLKADSGPSRFLEPPAAGSTDPGLAGRLQVAFGTAYLIERELGGAGMSRVFVATETALHRRVVIKVLPPDFAAEVDAERFHREIRLAASLRHPHVVPVHTAGQIAGVLYYTMPFVDGESLRQRLERQTPLSLDEVVSLLREITEALSYAHRRGIVHRDLKPANVLVEEGHALITDFGIATALASAAEGRTLGQSLTSTGQVPGTPSYMAPEQAAGDPVDHRADLYALGCVAYELLSGRPPFTGASAQALMAAHLADHPEPIGNRRAALPRPLSALVMRLLEKHPTARPHSAEEVLRELEALSTLARPASLLSVLGVYLACSLGIVGLTSIAMLKLGLPDWVMPGAALLLLIGLPIIIATALLHRGGMASPRSRRLVSGRAPWRWLTWRRAISGGVVAFSSLGIAVGGYMAMRALGVGPVGTLLASGVLSDRERVLLAGFQSPTHDTLLSAAVTGAFRIDFAQSTLVQLVPPERVAQVLERMRRSPSAWLNPALAREVAARDGVRAIMTGDIAPAGSGYLLSAKLMSAANGEVLVAHREAANDSTEIIPAIDRLSKRLRSRIGESLTLLRSERPLEQVTTASLEALRKFTQATRAGDLEGDHAKAVLLLKEAVALDTGFAVAHRALGVYLGILGERQQEVEALTSAFLHSDRLPDRERYVTRSMYYTKVTYELDKAVNGYRTHLETYPTDSVTLVNLGLIYGELRQYARAEELFRRAIAVDSALYPAYVNLISVQVALGKRAAAELTFDRAARLFPDNPYVMWWGGALATFDGDYSTAERRARALKERHGETPSLRALASEQLAMLATLRGRLAEAERYWQETMETYIEAASTPPYFAAAIALGLNDVWLRREPSRGLGDLEGALTKYPLTSLKLLDRPYLSLAVAYAAAGKSERARALLTDYEHAIEPKLRRPDQAKRHRAWGYVALAEGDYKGAIGEFRSYVTRVDGFCQNCGLPELGLAYDRSGEPDSAIAVYERYLSTPTLGFRFAEDVAALPTIYKRLGELFVQRGDRLSARAYYKRFVELWRDCDTALRPQLAEASQRLTELREEGAQQGFLGRDAATPPSGN
jgi:eukaryotic-like serine/threonine-protein kinase